MSTRAIEPVDLWITEDEVVCVEVFEGDIWQGDGVSAVEIDDDIGPDLCHLPEDVDNTAECADPSQADVLANIGGVKIGDRV